MEIARLIEELSQPAAYPYAVEQVEVHQTHISAVFLAGEYAYKIKKPVNPGFLDFTTLEKRRHYCEEEVRLNRRLAPEIYCGVVPVVRMGESVQFEGASEAIEWAVKMRRLPEAATLQERLRHDEVDAALVESLARRIASFHKDAEASERIAAYGRFEAVHRLLLDIFDQSVPHVGTTVSRTVYDRSRRLVEENLNQLRPRIEERAARGVMRDCHGDLHLDHVYFFPGRKYPGDLVIIDCIEFNERFRFIDPVADMAFPAMDFAFFGRRDLSRVFAEAYFRSSADHEGRALLPLYTAYRATVRGSVEGLLVAETEVPQAERSAALQKARAHWLLALAELEIPAQRPCLVLVAGLPGSGKSRLAQEIARHAGFCVIRSDVVRKEIAGLAPEEPTPSERRAALYAPEWTERTYAECARRAGELLFEGRRVLVDATFRQERQRQTFLTTATRWGVPSGLLICQAQPDTVRRRLAARHGDASDADWAIYLQTAQHWDKVGAGTYRHAHVISTEGDVTQARSLASAILQQLGLWE
jgi:aminoglycoside phosphotransferase family enzyme/predicted kinase